MSSEPRRKKRRKHSSVKSDDDRAAKKKDAEMQSETKETKEKTRSASPHPNKIRADGGTLPPGYDETLATSKDTPIMQPTPS